MSNDVLFWSVVGFILCLTVYILRSQCEKLVRKPVSDNSTNNTITLFEKGRNCCGFTPYHYVPVGFRVYHIFIILTGFLPIWGVIFGLFKWAVTVGKLSAYFDEEEPRERIIEGSFVDKVIKFFNFDLKK